MFYRAIRRAFLILAHPFLRFRVENVDRIPRTGPVVIVATHRSWLDAPCVGGACPRPVRFLIRDRVFHQNRLASWFYQRMGSVPVSPGGVKSIGAIRAALSCLRGGGVIGVFPEGRVVREGEREELRAGAALLAVRTGAPVVPIVIHGSAAAWPPGRRYPGPGRVRVEVGHPLPAPEGSREDAEQRLMDRIEAALPRDDTVNP